MPKDNYGCRSKEAREMVQLISALDVDLIPDTANHKSRVDPLVPITPVLSMK